MSKKKRRQRDNNSLSLENLLSPLQDVEDLRLFTPEAPRVVPRSISGNVVRVGARDGRRDRNRVLYPVSVIGNVPKQAVRNKNAWSRQQGTRMVFDAPKEVAICVRRKARREVLFAKRRTRKGAGSRRYRNEWSNINC